MGLLSQIVNTTIMVAVALPAIYYTKFLMETCDLSASEPFGSVLEATQHSFDDTCRVYLHHPLVYVNMVFLLNVCVLFWLISLVHPAGTWLIDQCKL